jgi:hypothetical protein
MARRVLFNENEFLFIDRTPGGEDRMAGIPTKTAEGLDYPTSDGKPMAETDWRRDLMNALIQTLAAYYAAEPMVYVSGNLLVFYKPGNRRRHLSPDVFVVKGVAKHQRPNYGANGEWGMRNGEWPSAACLSFPIPHSRSLWRDMAL